MKFYEKPVYNYKLGCENDPNRNMEAFNSEFEERVVLDAWVAMLEAFESIALACLIVTLILTLCTA